MAKEQVKEKEESFKRAGHLCYSPSGHAYQLSYAVRAEKNSRGVVFFKQKEKILCFRLKGDVQNLVFPVNPLEQFLSECYLDTHNRLFVYFLGHKFNLIRVSKFIKRTLSSRTQLVSMNFPQLHEFLIEQLVSYNSEYIQKGRIPGATFGIFTQKEPCVKLYPNNKIEKGSILYGGKIESEDFTDLFKKLKTNHVLKVNDENKEIELNVKNVKPSDYSLYDIFLVNLEDSNCEISQI